MNWITWIFLESPAALGGLAFAVNFFLLSYWRRSGRVRPLWISLLLSAGALMLQAGYETRRELARRILGPIERETVDGEIRALRDSLAVGFSAGDLGRDEFLAFAGRQLSLHDLTSIDLQQAALEESHADTFIICNRYRVEGRFSQLGPAGFYCTVRFGLVRRYGAWQIQAIHPPTIQGQQFSSWLDAAGR